MSLAELLNAAYEDALADEATRAQLATELAVPLCRLTKLLVPNVHQKIDEIVLAHEMGLTVNPAQHGADLLDAAGNAYEVKTSTMTKDGRCNINWNIPKAGKKIHINQRDGVRRAKLLLSVKKKVSGGNARFLIRDKAGHRLRLFIFSENFLSKYFAAIPIGASDTHNMGCRRCDTCKKFHRLEHFQKINDQLLADPNAVVDWNNLVTANIASQCQN